MLFMVTANDDLWEPDFLDRIASDATFRDAPDFTKTNFLNAALPERVPKLKRFHPWLA